MDLWSLTWFPAPAINISVVDFLDESLDEESLRMVDASHEYELTRNGNALVWNFNNVLLPPTEDDPVGSHGHITFKIKPEPGFEVGTIIPNTASIYFDFNPAIVTNTFNTEFVSQLGLSEIDASQFSVYANPANGVITVSSHSQAQISAISIYDLSGKKIIIHHPVNGDNTVNVSALRSGMYIIEVTTRDDQKYRTKLVVRQ